MLRCGIFGRIPPIVIGVRLLILLRDLSRRGVRRLPLAARVDWALLVVMDFCSI
jgi:hypothetical protein